MVGQLVHWCRELLCIFCSGTFFCHYHISVLASPVICKEILQNYRQSHCHSAFGACLGKVKH